MSPFPFGVTTGYPGMTIAYLPGPSDDVPLYEPWAGEPEVLAEAAAAGRRAAAWIRSLPGPPAPSPVGTWLAVTLPDVVESAMGSLDPAQCDRMGPDGRLIEGDAGVDAGTTSTLAIVPCVLSEAGWLTAHQHLRLMAVASVITGIARLLADDPGTAILHGQVWSGCAPPSTTRPARMLPDWPQNANTRSNIWMDRFPFPDDLISAQQQWHTTYRALAAPRLRHATELRRHLLALSVRIHWHPFWSTPTGRTPAARVELRQRTAADQTRVAA